MVAWRNKKRNKNKIFRWPALASIFAVFAGGILYGVVGIMIALPVTIILTATYRFYEDDISDKIEEIKVKK